MSLAQNSSRLRNKSMKTLNNQLRISYQQKKFCDFILNIGKGKNRVVIQAHSVVLCAFSKYFSKTLNDGSKILKTEFFNIKNVWTLEPIIDFMYYGSIKLTVENVAEILRSVCFLRIPILIYDCIQFIEKNINVSYVVSWRNAIKELRLSKRLEKKTYKFY